MYSVKNVVTGWSHERGQGGSYQANLYRGNKRVAAVVEEGEGDPLLFVWEDRNEPREEFTYVNFLGSAVTIRATTEQRAFLEHVSGLTYNCPFEKKERPMDGDFFVATLVQDFEDIKWLKKETKKKTVFRLNEDEPGKWRIVNSFYNEQVKEWIEKTYGSRLAQVANDLFVKKTVARPAKAGSRQPVKPGNGRRMSVLDAAYKVLSEAGTALDFRELADRAISAGYYRSRSGNPQEAMRDAVSRATQTDNRFERVGPGIFKAI